MIDIPLLAGTTGALCILFGFILVQRHIWTQDRFAYDFLNFIGSLLLVIYGISGKAWPFVVLNTIWASYSLKDMMLRKNSKTKRWRKNN